MKKQCKRKHYNTANHPAVTAVSGYLWGLERVTGEIHVLIGGDSDKMVNGAGRIFYVTLGGCAGHGIDPEDADVRILRGAVEALHDQAGVPTVDESRRLSLISGLQACNRLLQEIDREHINSAAADLAARLKHGDVRYSDFRGLV